MTLARDRRAPGIERPGNCIRSLDSAAELQVRYYELWVPHDLPKVTIGVAKVSGVATPERLLGRFDDLGAGRTSCFHHAIDLGTSVHVVSEAEFSR